MSIVYLALGSNLANPQQQLEQALLGIANLPQTQLVAQSGFYQNPAIGPGEQDDYINAVVQIKTELVPLELLQQTQAIEEQHGRVRDIRWGARQLDIDIILFAQLCSDDPVLTLPHPRACERNFVMLPLFEIAPKLIWPNGKAIHTFAAAHDHQGLSRLETSI